MEYIPQFSSLVGKESNAFAILSHHISEETREAKAEMRGLCQERCEEGGRGGRLEEEDKRQRRVEKTIR